MTNRDVICISVKDFVNNATQIKCCGSCPGGCEDELVCFICCGYSISDIIEYFESNPKARERRDQAIRDLQDEEELAYWEYVDSGKEAEDDRKWKELMGE